MARGIKRPSGKPNTLGGRTGSSQVGKAQTGADQPAAHSGRGLTVRVKTAKQRTLSSTRWLERQLNDPYVADARRLGYRSRAAFKLIELDDRFHLLGPGKRIVDLGCAPGGWTQVAVQRVHPGAKGGIVIGIDYLGMEPIPDAQVLELDFLDPTAPQRLKDLLGGPADVVLSDMAAPTTGHPPTDHIRIIALAETAYAFAAEVLAPGGSFVAKVFQGGTERGLLELLKRSFSSVRHAKPPASRTDSAEMYVVATGFRGDAAAGAEQA
ncbi:MAG TPA: RlmE family RNA methyltransferase [Stellaceae bacterium]|nr:RlmE family RNA methyltransferase [Stellaceae bacterium]